MVKEFKVEVVTESGCGTVFLGSAALPLQKIEAVLRIVSDYLEYLPFPFIGYPFTKQVTHITR